VCAYHHDIGKIPKPEYYTENEAGAQSRHARLTPSMSALVIKSHVTEGLEIARQEKLPPAVSAAIPEHHGTTVMAFFYAKALEQDPTTSDSDYRYRARARNRRRRPSSCWPTRSRARRAP